MKKFLSIILCVLMIVPCFSLFAFAEETEEEEISNLALNSSLKYSSMWNASTHPKSVINGSSTGDIKAHMSWSGHLNYWQPDSPSHNGDSSIDPHLQWLQFSFKGKNKGYKLIDSVDIWAYADECHSMNVFTIFALINGLWIEVGSMSNSDVAPLEDYPERVKLHFEMPDSVEVEGAMCKVNTQKIKVECTKFGIDGCSHGWHVPTVYEVEIFGKTGEIPEIDLHDGALLSTNAALSGHISASSSANGAFPYLGADNYSTTQWRSSKTTDGEWIAAEFDAPYDLESLKLNFGASNDVKEFQIVVEALANGVWKEIETKTITTFKSVIDDKQNTDKYVVIDLGTNKTAIEGIRVTFKSQGGAAAELTEMIATIADNKKCEYLFEFLTVNRKQSLANKNLAIYGEPYASSVFDHLGISDVLYLNDGSIMNADYAWYSNTFAAGQYCGIALEKELNVDKVVLYFNDEIIGGYDARDYFIFGYDVQVKVDGEYKTVATGTNLDASKANSTGLDKHIITIQFPAEKTDDVRILFTETDIGFVFLKELEIYGEDAYNEFCTYLHGRTNTSLTTNFAAPFIIGRATFLNWVSPIETMMSINDIKASLWI